MFTRKKILTNTRKVLEFKSENRKSKIQNPGLTTTTNRKIGNRKLENQNPEFENRKSRIDSNSENRNSEIEKVTTRLPSSHFLSWEK